MRLSFDSIDEVKEFVKQLKGTRGGKGDKDEETAPQTGNSPAPLAPPTTAAAIGFPGGQAGFTAPPAGGAAPQAGAFPATVAPTTPAIDPAIAAWVSKISGVIDATANTPKAGEMLQWFRNSFGAEAASATAEQIKTIFLPRLNVEQLAQMGKMMGLS